MVSARPGTMRFPASMLPGGVVAKTSEDIHKEEYLIAEALDAVCKGAVQDEEAVRTREPDQVHRVAVPSRPLERNLSTAR